MGKNKEPFWKFFIDIPTNKYQAYKSTINLFIHNMKIVDIIVEQIEKDVK